MSGATSWRSELPSGHNPFWIRDEAMAELGLHPGDAVGVDTAAEPSAGDLVLVEVELDDRSERLIRRYAAEVDGTVRLLAASSSVPELQVGPDQHLVLGVVRTRVTFQESGDQTQVTETPLA
jgi:SOS-response transcriptional repressor LexA